MGLGTCVLLAVDQETLAQALAALKTKRTQIFGMQRQDLLLNRPLQSSLQGATSHQLDIGMLSINEEARTAHNGNKMILVDLSVLESVRWRSFWIKGQ